MGRFSRKNKTPNLPKWSRAFYQPLVQDVDTPQGRHKFAMLPLSYAIYWVTPQGPWRRVAEDARK